MMNTFFKIMKEFAREREREREGNMNWNERVLWTSHAVPFNLDVNGADTHTHTHARKWIRFRFSSVCLPVGI